MGRTKLYERDALLDAAMRVFWQRGYADTSVQQLERATGVNKSGLYAEFQGKEDLYLASLRHYVAQRGAEGLLTQEPPGWPNVERLLKRGPVCSDDSKGCFAINAMRELQTLPDEAAQIVAHSQAAMLALLVQNISAQATRMPAKAIAEIVLTFFSGLCIEMNLSPSQAGMQRKVKHFMAMLKTL